MRRLIDGKMKLSIGDGNAIDVLLFVGGEHRFEAAVNQPTIYFGRSIGGKTSGGCFHNQPQLQAVDPRLRRVE